MAQVMERGTPVVTVPGVSKVDEKKLALQRRLVVVVTVVPFLGLIAAIWQLWGQGLSGTDAGIALFFYMFTGLGVTVGFHRYFTHQSFRTNRFMRGLLATAGSMSVQGSVIEWVADHRRHHAFSDKEGDPHSPHLEGAPGVRGVLKGLAHAHMGWFFDDEETSRERWTPDLLKDPLIVKIDRLFPRLTIATFALPPLLGFLFTGTWQGALTAGLWGSLVRIFMLHHVTWSINSICHFYGKRPFRSDDYSTNNWVLSIVSFGESWHNNHHAFPTSAVHGLGKAQFDMSGVVITALEKVGLVHDVKRVSERQLDAKAAG